MDNAKTQPPGVTGNDTAAALEAGRRLALELKPHPLGKRFAPYAIMRHEDGVETVEGGDPLDFPPDGFAGTAEVHDAESFLKMWAEHQCPWSRVYAEMLPAVRFTAVFDEHDQASDPESFPRWREHRCVYTPKHSPEWNTWKAQDRKPFGGNTEFALWLEDNLPDISEPAADQLLQIVHTFRVDEGLAWQNQVNLHNGHTDLTYRRVVDGQASDQGGWRLEIPQQFKISIPVFQGLEATVYDIDARFRYRVRERSLAIWYELVRPHKVLELAFRDLVARFRTGTVERLFFGSPER